MKNVTQITGTLQNNVKCVVVIIAGILEAIKRTRNHFNDFLTLSYLLVVFCFNQFFITIQFDRNVAAKKVTVTPAEELKKKNIEKQDFSPLMWYYKKIELIR